MPLISIHNLKKRFNEKEILNDISLDIQEGDILGIIGASGSGKSVLLKHIIGFYKPGSGKITFSPKSSLPCTFGFSAQNNSLYENLTVNQNLSYFGSMYGLSSKEIKKNTKELIELTALNGNENLLVSKLSGGMKKRLDIACSLIHKPKVLILDEPFAGLDYVLIKKIILLLKKIQLSGTTIILTSHQTFCIEKLCTRAAIIENAKIKLIGSPVEVLRSYKKHG